MNAIKLGRALGWFSIGLGVSELLFGRRLGRMLGLEHRTGTLRLFGLREIATGLGIFASVRKRPWLWGRVAGDALDLAVLAAAARSDNPQSTAARVAFGNVAAVTALDVLCARQLPV